ARRLPRPAGRGRLRPSFLRPFGREGCARSPTRASARRRLTRTARVPLAATPKMVRGKSPEEAMAERLGSGEWSFAVNEAWAKIPDEIVLGDCAAVGVDSKDNVYAFNRGHHPVAVFDKDGKLLRTWGEGVFTRPHGVHVAPDDTIWLTDDGDHTVRHCTPDGRVLMTLGIPGKPAPYMSGEPFHRCTHTALSPQCDHLYISD